MDTLTSVASRSPYLTAQRLDLHRSELRSRRNTWWQKREPLSPHEPNLSGIMSEVLPEVGADVGPPSGKSVRRPASIIWFGLTALLQLWAKSDQKLIKVIAEKGEWDQGGGKWRSRFLIWWLSNLFITPLNLQHRKELNTVVIGGCVCTSTSLSLLWCRWILVWQKSIGLIKSEGEL